MCGGDARIRKTRITVWGLVEWRSLGLSDAQILEHHPDLTQENLQAAWEYYSQHQEEIDQAIRENHDEEPVALMIGIKGLDEEQLQLGTCDQFWELMSERRREPTMGRGELERNNQSTSREQ